MALTSIGELFYFRTPTKCKKVNIVNLLCCTGRSTVMSINTFSIDIASGGSVPRRRVQCGDGTTVGR